MEKLKEVCEMKHNLIDWLKRDLTQACCNLDNAAAIECAGEVVDMIKDLAQAEKDCVEAKYYKTVIEAMEQGEEARYGYNHNRYASGRFAPSGHGNMTGGRSGYNGPYLNQYPYVDGFMHDPNFEEVMMGPMGYSNSGGSGSSGGGRGSSGNSGGGRGGNSGSSSGGRGSNGGGRMGMTDNDWDDHYSREYNEYRNAKRHYTESRSDSDKEAMESHGLKHFKESLDTMREIYMNSDTENKRKLKSELTKLVSEMPT